MRSTLLALTAALFAAPAFAQRGATPGCETDITVPPGFCVTVYADTVRGARHLWVAPNGDVYVSAQQSGRGGGGGLWMLRDENGSGRATRRVHLASGFN